MSITSYAQNLEDVMLWRALADVEHGFYIDVGAQDPLIDSVSLAFYQRGWHGIHVEPIRHYADLLRQQRPGDTVVEAAVGTGPSIIRFFEISGTGLSTADPDIAAQHRARGFDVRETNVTCIPLSAVFAVAESTEIHWLKIDVEGLEQQVLFSWGAHEARPWIVVVESTVPLTQIDSREIWEQMLLGRGYTAVYFDGLNRYYASDAHRDLAASFNAPPNVFDEFVLNGTASATFHKNIQSRLQKQLDEINAGAQQQQLALRRDIKSLRQDLSSQQAAHAERELTSGERVREARQEVERLQQRLLQCEHDFGDQLQLILEQTASERKEQTTRLLELQLQLENARRKLAESEVAFKASLEAKQQELLQSDLARTNAQRVFDRQLELLRAALYSQTQTLDDLHRQIFQLRHSFTWRMTAPLRALWRRVGANSGSPNPYQFEAASSIRSLGTGMAHMLRGDGTDRSASGASSAADRLASLLQLDNDDFVRCAYVTILRREPDHVGLEHFLKQLRIGRPKMLILRDIYSSKEATAQHTELPWLREALHRYWFTQLPVLGWLLRPFLFRNDSSDIEHRMQFLEHQVYILSRQIALQLLHALQSTDAATTSVNASQMTLASALVDLLTDSGMPPVSLAADQVFGQLAKAVAAAHTHG